MAGFDDSTYVSGLSEFVDKTIQRWARNKKQFLEPKFRRNYEAVTNRDYRIKTWKQGEGEGWRSRTWIGYVRVKIWSFYAVLLDTVLKAGKIPFTLDPSPYDDEVMEPEMIQDRDERIEHMEDKITEQLTQRKADREYMKKWLSGGYYGMAFSKFNVEAVQSMEFVQVDMDIGNAAQYLSPEELEQYRRYEPQQIEEDVPGHRYVSVWNMVWDMEADGLQEKDGSAGYAERVLSSAYDLRQLDGPGYIKDAISRVIDRKRDSKYGDTGSDDDEVDIHPGINDLNDRKKGINRFEFYMRAPRKLVDEFEKIIKSSPQPEVFRLGLIEDYEDAETGGDEVEVMGEIADKEIIRFIRNDTGKRPHHMWVVERNLDESTGSGIADNMEDVQASLVGMIRAFEDNKKLSANVTAAVKKRWFNKPTELDDVEPGKLYDIADGADDVRKAIMPIVFADVGETLISGIHLMMQMKDDVSMIPTIMQGFTLPKHTPDTAYEMRQLTENAGKYIGQAIRNNDEQFIEPEIRDIYEYNMLFDEDESIKVNAKVKANGFTSFQSKEIRGERMKQALALFVSNEFLIPEVQIKPHLEIIYESMDEDPEKFLKSKEMKQDESEQAQAAQEAEEQKAVQAFKMEAQKELDLKEQEHRHKLAEQEQQHKFKMEEQEQKSVHAVEEETHKDNLSEAREVQE